jgi:uncharacterized membrane protein YvlD (DUF360 family)
MKEKLSLILRQFNWRMLLMRIVMYSLLLALVVLLTPNTYFTDRRLSVMIVTAIGFGLISAIVRPIIQFVTLPFIFATYGLVIVFINVIILLMLNWVFGDVLVVGGLFTAILGGVLIGVFGGFLESALGLTAPIIPDSEEELRKRIKFQDRGLMYAVFQAAPAELQKYAPVAGSLTELLPSSPDTQDVQAILATLDAAQGSGTPEAPAPTSEPPPSKPRRRLRRTPAVSESDASTGQEESA